MEQIKIDNYSFSYCNQTKKALNNISLSIKKGEMVVVCGKSGCGKSTFLKSLKPEILENGVKSGNIEIEGKVSFVMQNPDHQIVTDKVWHELAFGLENRGEKSQVIRGKVAEVAEYFGITDLYYRDTDSLSGGQKQLVNIAAAMVMDPDILILDEPTSALDPIVGEQLIDILGKINEDFGVTIIISEHRLNNIVALSDKLLVMEDGEIIINEPVTSGIKKMPESLWPFLPVEARIFLSNNGQGQVPINIKEGRKYINDNKSKISIINDNKIKNKVIVKGKNIWFRYDRKDNDVIRGLNLEVEKGEIFAIVGGNGTGKTTTLKLISQILKPNRGKIKIDGITSMLPQNVQVLFSKETVKEQLESVSSEIIEQLNLSLLLERHPYDLSGGEQQKVGLAMIIAANPDIIILDEPTKGIDNIYKEELGAYLQAFTEKGGTVIIVSHDLDFCGEYANRVAMIADGMIVSQGTSKELFENNRFYTTTPAKLTRNLELVATKMEELLW